MAKDALGALRMRRAVASHAPASDPGGTHLRCDRSRADQHGAAVAAWWSSTPRLPRAEFVSPRCSSLAVLGAVGAKAGGADIVRGVLRVTFWRAIAMAATALIGKIFGTVV